jgi:hypothetical protein
MATTSFQADLLVKHRGLVVAQGSEMDYGVGEATRDLLAIVAVEDMVAKVRAMAAGVDEEGMDRLGGGLGIDPPLSLLPFADWVLPHPNCSSIRALLHLNAPLMTPRNVPGLSHTPPPVCVTLPAGFTVSRYHRLSPPHFCSPRRRFMKSPLS